MATGAVAGRRILGTTIDIQPKAADPRLELRFAKTDADALPADNKAPIRLKLNGWLGFVVFAGVVADFLVR